MLSFMREEGAAGSSGNQAKGSGRRNAKVSDTEGAQEYLTVAANSKSLRKSTILVVILVAIGLACLWFMIRKSRPQAASAKASEEEQTKIEVAIGRLTGVSSEMVSRMDQIVKKFYEFSNVFQVQVNELVKNPFEVEVFMKDIKEEVGADETAGAQGALIRRQRLKQRASTLQLLSVMQSSGASSCMINDQILRPGERIEGFIITRIGGDFVELAWQGDNESGKADPATEDLTIMIKLSQ